MRILTDRGTEYCGSPERHDYQLYPAIEDIDHSRTKNEVTADERHLRTLSQNDAGRVLFGGVATEGLSINRRAANRS